VSVIAEARIVNTPLPERCGYSGQDRRTRL